MCPDHRATLEMGDAFVETGTCGEERFLAFRGLFGGVRAYFDARGALVAAEATSDMATKCGDATLSFATTYGATPSCTPREVRSLCP
jgi:hypothetical protein